MSSARGRDFGHPPTAYLQLPVCRRLGRPDDTAPHPSGLGSARRSRGAGPVAMAGSGAALILQARPGGAARARAGRHGYQNVLVRLAASIACPGAPLPGRGAGLVRAESIGSSWGPAVVVTPVGSRSSSRPGRPPAGSAARQRQ